jgi:SAM-dependent methyltransferase
MKIGARPESVLERLGLWLGLVPVPLLETHVCATLARSIMAGVELGVFDVLAAAPLAGNDIAGRCHTDPDATMLLLDALTASRYLRLSQGRYALAPQSRKWLLGGSDNSLRDKILLQAVEWRWLAGLEMFVRTGRPLDFHESMSELERRLYHRSMRALAGIAGREVAWRTPIPRSARRMLDLGGSHGHFAAAICRRRRALRAEVLDLPSAIDHAAPLLAAEGLGDRVIHVAGDVISADLGVEQYDLILMSNLAHHLDLAQNQDVARRAARALRPGGVFVIQEPVRPIRPSEAGQTGTLLGLYFALQSRPGVKTWTVADLAGWQVAAGLRPRRAMRIRTAPGWVQQSARR